MSKLAREIEGAFREKGIRFTSQRFLLLEHLMRSDIHESADEIYLSVNRKMPKMSRASVYNNLHALSEAGLVRQVPSEGNIARFDANIHRHHHFICDVCAAVEDVPWFEPPQPGDTGLRKYKIRSFEAVLRGTCPKCK